MREENSNEYNVLEQGFTDQVFFLFLKQERERDLWVWEQIRKEMKFFSVT